MLQLNNRAWWMLVVVALLVLFAWPPETGKSLAAKFVNWAVDPRNELPIEPEELPLGMEHDYEAVTARDLELMYYDELYDQGGLTRWRLEMKAANDPFDPGTERRMLTALAVITGLVAWRMSAKKSNS